MSAFFFQSKSKTGNSVLYIRHFKNCISQEGNEVNWFKVLVLAMPKLGY